MMSLNNLPLTKRDTKKHLINIYILLIFFIGISSPIYILSFKQKSSFFSNYSPLPILFSDGDAAFYSKVDKKIILQTKSKSHTFKFTRNFYSSLGGPHTRKLQFASILSKTNRLTDDRSIPFFKNTFCENNFHLSHLGDESVERIIIKINNTEALSVSCHP